jgi:dihydropteroate synthase
MFKPLLMGILNVTPDSFSDGGLHFSKDSAIDAGFRMLDEGADLIDVGGESTRPNAMPVAAGEEMNRVMPVIEALVARGASISVDTSKAIVAAAALGCGAKILNDVTALRDPDMAEVCRLAGCTVCLMHMKGDPRTMQNDPTYDDVVAEVRDFLKKRAALARSSGVAAENIWVDPGIGFGKTVEHNLALLHDLATIVDDGYPVVVGVSRKSFIGKILGGAPVGDRLEGSLAAQVLAQKAGVAVIRAHDVRSSRRAIDMTAAILA